MREVLVRRSERNDCYRYQPDVPLDVRILETTASGAQLGIHMHSPSTVNEGSLWTVYAAPAECRDHGFIYESAQWSGPLHPGWADR